MARRRDRGRGVAEAFQSMQPFIQALLQDQLISKRQREAATYQQEFARQQAEAARQAEIAKDAREARQAIPKAIDAPTSVAGLPTERGILGMAQQAGMNMTPQMPAPRRQPPLTEMGEPRPPVEGELPSFNFPVTHAPAIETLMAQRAEKEKALIASAEEEAKLKQRTTLRAMPFYSEPGKRMFQQFVPESELASYGALPQEPTPKQFGENWMEQKLGTELSPAFASAKARADNAYAELTLPSKTKEAYATGFAREQAQQAPSLVQGRLSEFEQRAKIEAQYRPATELERRSEMNLNVLLNADAQASDSEMKGLRIPTFALTVAQSPALTSANAWLSEVTRNVSPRLGGQMGVPPEVLNFVNQAVDYTNTLNYMRTGVAGRENEYQRFITNLFPLEGEAPAAVQEKQRRRAIFNAAVRMSLTGDKKGAGRALARSVQQNKIPEDFIQSLQLDPEVLAGFEAELAATAVRPR